MPISFLDETAFTRKRIIRAAKDVLAHKKVSGMRMRQVASQAGISMGTLHYHFPSKTRLLLAVLDDMQAFFEKRQEHLLSNKLTPVKKIELFFTQQKQLLLDQPDIEEIFLDFWGHGMVDSAVREKIRTMYLGWREDILATIQQGAQSGDFEPGQVEIAPYLMVALLEGFALQFLLDQCDFNLEQAFQVANRLMIHWLQSANADMAGQLEQEDERFAKKLYPSDLSEVQWLQIEPLIQPAKTGGRPRTTNLREVLNAMLYLHTCNCTWRMLPHDFPGWQSVYGYWKQWKDDGTLAQIGETLKIDLTKSVQI